jgi:predicted DNA-binding transcriptional regulator AlpA
MKLAIEMYELTILTKENNMKKNDDLFSMADVCEFFGLSESTIRRKIKNSRDGEGNFPLPLFGSKCRVLWKKEDILNWGGEDSETIHYTPSLPPPTHSVTQMKNNTQVRKELEKLGIKLPEQSAGN